ncbi:MAG: hypothetical protein ACTSYL_06200 [Candidatus Thorarchaeota archaeon]
MLICTSGLHSGINPSPGVGTARSIKDAFPQAHIIGVDYSTRCSGLHSPDLDEVWLQEAWQVIDLDQYADQIRLLLDEGKLWISGLDLETYWLAESIGSHPNLLVPPLEALKRASKPVYEIGHEYDLAIPPFIRLTEPEWEIHKFCRRNDWHCWVKGPNYEAQMVRDWSGFHKARRKLSATWSTVDDLFLQAHILGLEECIAFSAYHGELLGSAHMIKRDVTKENKTWAAKVSPVPEDLSELVANIIHDLKWTGGGEFEFVRDSQGTLWLLEINPRFPAWIYGATLAGINLPGRLVQAATGDEMLPQRRASSEFVRIVIEVPVRDGYNLPPLQHMSIDERDSGLKHPSGMPLLSKRLRGTTRKIPRVPTSHDSIVPSAIRNAVQSIKSESLETPAPVLLESILQERIVLLKEALARVSNDRVKVTVAYSVKTDPDSKIMHMMKDHGLLAEAISQLEVLRALSSGFSPSEIVLNGPGMWWPENETPSPLHAIMSDTLNDLEQLVEGSRQRKIADVIGIRIHPPDVESRFGIPIYDYSQFDRLVQIVKRCPPDQAFGVHLHLASSRLGVKRWKHMVEAMLHWAVALEHLTGVPIKFVDLGGGWFPDDFDEVFLLDLPSLVDTITRLLPHVTEIELEPGKALVQPATCMVSRVINLQESEAGTNIIVDASIADLPQALYFPHRLLFRSKATGQWLAPRNGDWRVTGRLCMETDVLAEDIDFAVHPQIGDLIVFLDSGAYDRSMSYDFGKG